MKICKECNSQFTENIRFCEVCGNEIKEDINENLEYDEDKPYISPLRSYKGTIFNHG